MPAQTTPRKSGFRFPAEWEPQEAIWFAWPVRRTLWADCFDRVREQLVAIYLLAAQFQTVRVLCAMSEQADLLAMMPAHEDLRRIELFDYQTDDVWIRDFGPLFLIHATRSEVAISDWRYNAWGNKFPEQSGDDRATQWIAERLGIRHFAIDKVLEGGAVESNGAGCLLTTEVVLLNPNRNGRTTMKSVEHQLSNGLATEKVLWLKDGLVGDDTDGHIDNLARFFKPDGILVATTTDANNPNYEVLTENQHRLRKYRTRAGNPFDVVPLPLPDPIHHAGELLAASYLNFVVLNGAVLVPTYSQPENDRRAMQILAECFPSRKLLPIDCGDIVKEGGALHCMSQHQPATAR